MTTFSSASPSLPLDREKWDDDMLNRLLQLQQPTLRAEMVNFAVEEANAEKLIGFITRPSQPTDIDSKKLQNDESDTTAVARSYRATLFLTGGFDSEFDRLPDKQQAALAHFYGLRGISVLSAIFEALADRPVRVNVHHIHRLWEACSFFARSVTIDFFTMPGESLHLCLGALLDLADHGSIASMYADVVGLFLRQPFFFGNSFHVGRRKSKSSLPRSGPLADALGDCEIFEQITRIACGEDGGDRSAAHCNAIAELHAHVLFDIARESDLEPVFHSFGRGAATSFKMFANLLDRSSLLMESAQPDGSNQTAKAPLDMLVTTASAVLAATLNCCGREELEALEQPELMRDAIMEDNHFRGQRGPLFAAGATIVPSICRYAKALVEWHKRSAPDVFSNASGPTSSGVVMGFRYPLALDGVLKVLIELLRDDPAGTADAMAMEEFCAPLAEWVFLFPGCSIFHCKFKEVFSLATIRGCSQTFLQGILAPPSEGGGDMLRRMIELCEDVSQVGSEQQGSDKRKFHCQKTLAGLLRCCLNIIRLKADELRTNEEAECDPSRSALPSLLAPNCPDTPGRHVLANWLLPFLDAHDKWTGFLPKLVEETRAERPKSAAPRNSDAGSPFGSSPLSQGRLDLFEDGLLVNAQESLDDELDKIERESIDLGSDFARDLGFNDSHGSSHINS